MAHGDWRDKQTRGRGQPGTGTPGKWNHSSWWVLHDIEKYQISVKPWKRGWKTDRTCSHDVQILPCTIPVKSSKYLMVLGINEWANSCHEKKDLLDILKVSWSSWSIFLRNIFIAGPVRCIFLCMMSVWKSVVINKYCPNFNTFSSVLVL